MKIKIEDNVLVITGKNKGKIGKVAKTFKKTNKIIVEGVNIRTKHVKKTNNKPGQKIQFEAPIDASNVKVLCPVTKKATRIGYLHQGGKKIRIAKKSSEALDKKITSKK